MHILVLRFKEMCILSACHYLIHLNPLKMQSDLGSSRLMYNINTILCATFLTTIVIIITVITIIVIVVMVIIAGLSQQVFSGRPPPHPLSEIP